MAFICLMTIQQPHVCFLKRGKGVFGSQWWFQANYNRRLLTFYFVAVISFLLGHLINLSSSYLNLCVLGCKRIEYFFWFINTSSIFSSLSFSPPLDEINFTVIVFLFIPVPMCPHSEIPTHGKRNILILHGRERKSSFNAVMVHLRF